MEASDELLSMFLGFMHKPKPNPPRDVAQVESILELYRKYECELAAERFAARVDDSIFKQDSWRGFVLASQYNQPFLASKALSCMIYDQERRHMDIEQLTVADASELPVPYLLALIDRLDRNPVADFQFSLEQRWQEISYQFQPRASA